MISVTDLEKDFRSHFTRATLGWIPKQLFLQSHEEHSNMRGISLFVLLLGFLMCLQIKEIPLYIQVKGLSKETNTINEELNMTNNILHDTVNLDRYIEFKGSEYALPLLPHFICFVGL